MRELPSGDLKQKFCEDIIKRYTEVTDPRSRFDLIQQEPHFLSALQLACPAMTWTHSILHDMNSIVDNLGSYRAMIRDTLINGVIDPWSHKFDAGKESWKVNYIHYRPLDSRAFTAETNRGEKRAILWFVTGSKVPHDSQKLKEICEPLVKKFQQLLAE